MVKKFIYIMLGLFVCIVALFFYYIFEEGRWNKKSIHLTPKLKLKTLYLVQFQHKGSLRKDIIKFLISNQIIEGNGFKKNQFLTKVYEDKSNVILEKDWKYRNVRCKYLLVLCFSDSKDGEQVLSKVFPLLINYTNQKIIFLRLDDPSVYCDYEADNKIWKKEDKEKLFQEIAIQLAKKDKIEISEPFLETAKRNLKSVFVSSASHKGSSRKDVITFLLSNQIINEKGFKKNQLFSKVYEGKYNVILEKDWNHQGIHCRYLLVLCFTDSKGKKQVLSKVFPLLINYTDQKIVFLIPDDLSIYCEYVTDKEIWEKKNREKLFQAIAIQLAEKEHNLPTPPKNSSQDKSDSEVKQ